MHIVPIEAMTDDSDSLQRNATPAAEASSEPASPPFDDSRGDITLRTSDNIDFHVLKAILELSSPVFKDMLSLPQPVKEESTTQGPVIPISEPSIVLDALLRICYPIERPEVFKQDMSLCGLVLGAALKYDMTAPADYIKNILRKRSQENGENALAVYAIACSLKQEEEAYLAANECLKWPVLDTPVPQLMSISGMDCYNLVDFHRRAGQAVTKLFKQYSFLKSTCSDIYAYHHDCVTGKTYVSCNGTESTYLYQWWADSKSTIADSLRWAPFDYGRITLSSVAPAVKANLCRECVNSILLGWDKAKSKMINDIEKEIAKVELYYSWKKTEN